MNDQRSWPSRDDHSRPRVHRSTLLLGAPVIWIVYFWVVYLLAETGCDAESGGWIGDGALTASVLAATVIAIGSTIGLVWLGFDRSRPPPSADGRESAEYRLMVVYLCGLFVLAILMIGLPAAIVSPC